MKSPEQRVTLPLEYATELSMEMLLMRGECCDAARALVEPGELDEEGLEECAVLDEALAQAQSILQQALISINQGRAARGQSVD